MSRRKKYSVSHLARFANGLSTMFSGHRGFDSSHMWGRRERLSMAVDDTASSLVSYRAVFRLEKEYILNSRFAGINHLMNRS